MDCVAKAVVRAGVRGTRVGPVLLLICGLFSPMSWAHEDAPVPGSECANEGPFGLPGLALDPEQIGQWGPVEPFPFQATHSAVLHTGKVMVWRRGIDSPTNQKDQPPYLWDPADHSLRLIDQPDHTDDLFCSGHSTLADGRLLITGGTVNRLNKFGSRDTHAFDPVSETWTKLANLNVGRWYPTVTTLSDGRVIAMSGDITPQERSNKPEIYDPETNRWTLLSSGRLNTETYPFNFVAPDGNYFYAGGRGPQSFSWELDMDSGKWSRGPRVNHRGGQGASGSAAMYRPGKIIKIGGRQSSSNEFDGAEVIDLTAANPAWREVEPMMFFRRRADMVLLPDGTGLAIGGSKAGQASHECAVHAAELWDPDTETWTQMASHARPRIYHSTAVLLPDGRILAAGGENHDGTEENGEVYSPPYLFKGERPLIESAPATVGYGTTFLLQSPDAEDIASVALMRPAAATHNFDQNQRYVPLDFTLTPDGMSLLAPPNGAIAPPGYYMLFLVNSNGVPSIAHWIQVLDTGEGGNQLPSVDIQGPDNNAEFAFGESITFMATAGDAEDGDLGSSIQWSSDRDGYLGEGAVLEVASLQPGPHFVTATVIDQAGAEATESVILTVNFAGGGSLITLDALGDSIVRKKKPTTRHGGLSYIPVQRNQHGYVVFDTSLLSGPISSAVLKLHVGSVIGSGTLQVHRVLGDWEESTVVWNNQPAFALEPAGSIAINDTDADTIVELNIAMLVSQWGLDPESDFGLALTAADGLNVRLSSREGEIAPVIEAVDVAVPSLSLLAPSENDEFFQGFDVQFSASATDTDDTDLSADIVWSSDLDGELGQGAQIVVATLSAGRHQITATVLNSEMQTGELSFSILVIEAMPIEFLGTLDAQQVVGGSSPASSGSGRIALELNAERTALDYRIELDAPLFLSPDISTETDANAVTAIHLHTAPAGANGPHVLNIFGLPSEDDGDMVADLETGVITGRWDDLDAFGDPASPGTSKRLSDFITALIEDDLYLGVHTVGAGGGVALRAQLTRQGATTVLLGASQDSFTRRDKPDLKLGRLSYLRVAFNRHGFIDFDSSQIEGSVASATLHLPIVAVAKPGVVVVNYALAPWDELAITHNTRPALNAISEGAIDIAKEDEGSIVSLDVTSRVREWLENPASAAGFGVTSSLGAHVVIASKERDSDGVSELPTGPYLEIVFN